MSATLAPTPVRYHLAERLEKVLGDPEDPQNPCGFDAAVERDSRGGFPKELADVARAEGLALSVLPVDDGGNLVSFDRTLAAARVAARRDASVMPATMFSVTGATCVLVHGSTAQRRAVAEVLRGGGAVGFALSEPDTGSDLLAAGCALDGPPGGRRLTGTKWLVGLGDNGGLVYLVARSGLRGPGAFSSVLLPQGELPSECVVGGNAATGLTGIPLSTLRFDHHPVDEGRLVGRPGDGLAVAMKSMQVVRVLSTAATLGCSDLALRTAVRFVTGHRVGGAPVLAWAPARRELAVAAAAHVAIDAVALSSARALHVRPGSFGVPSAVAKRVAVTLSELVMARCSDLLASRSVLTTGPGARVGKAHRDNDVVRYIDTSPAATLRLLAGQVSALALGRARQGGHADDGERARRLAVTHDLRRELPTYQPALLDLAARDDDVIEAWADVARAVGSALAGSGDPLAQRTRALLARGADEVQRLLAEPALQRAPRDDGGLAQLDLAARFASLYAAGCCLQLWWHNRAASVWGEAPGSVRWLLPALALLLDGEGARAGDVDPGVDLLLGLTRRRLLFSAVPVPLAERDQPTERGAA